MANLKISELNAAEALTGDELVELVQDGGNVKATAQAIADLATPVAASVAFTPSGNVAASNVQTAIEELDDEKLAVTGDVLVSYHETAATLTPVAGAVTIPLDGKTYAVSVTAAITTITTTVPASPAVGSCVVYFTQDDDGYAVSLPAAWLWMDGTITPIDATANAVTRLTLTSDPAGNVHADASVRATA